MKQEIYSPIPERTWRWLGVNDTRYSFPTTEAGRYDKSPLTVPDARVRAIDELPEQFREFVKKAENAAVPPAAASVGRSGLAPTARTSATPPASRPR